MVSYYVNTMVTLFEAEEWSTLYDRCASLYIFIICDQYVSQSGHRRHVLSPYRNLNICAPTKRMSLPIDRGAYREHQSSRIFDKRVVPHRSHPSRFSGKPSQTKALRCTLY